MNIAKILKDLGSIKPHVSAAAMRTILDNPLDPTLRAALVKALKSQNHLCRGSAAIAAGRLLIKESVPGLIPLLKDNDLRTRCFAAAALGKLGDRRAIAPLEKLALDTEELYQHKLVVGALRKLKSVPDKGKNARRAPTK